MGAKMGSAFMRVRSNFRLTSYIFGVEHSKPLGLAGSFLCVEFFRRGPRFGAKAAGKPRIRALGARPQEVQQLLAFALSHVCPTVPPFLSRRKLGESVFVDAKLIFQPGFVLYSSYIKQ